MFKTIEPLVLIEDGTKAPVAFNKDHGLFLRKFKPDASTCVLLNNPLYDLMDIHMGDTVLDLGAWVGRFAKYAFDRGALHVLSVEGDPNNYHILKRNRDLPGFKSPEQKHSLIGGCIWPEITENESHRCYMSVGFSQNTSLHTTRDIAGGSRIWTNKVPFKYLMPYAQPDVVKIDIEGGEHRLLRMHHIAMLLEYVRDVWVSYHVRTRDDVYTYKAIHQDLIEILGCYVIEPDFDVKVKRKAYWLHETVGLYRNTYVGKVLLNTKTL